ncbi:hypothetical protein AV947_gp10 [Podophage Lau218]|uniref:Putative phage protein n=2 Tax=Lauvirus lau218 TaxID=1465639 RepID=A0A060BGT8_9CAUD|nr:hypothetical protein AV947_gp10 [Podophage Lau218]AIA83125.1 putative phage protein [Podophage Lau218]AIA83173.1 putative phage protein [Lauvirus lau218]AIA83221.1 putative phage protein [Lauvirus lau218]
MSKNKKHYIGSEIPKKLVNEFDNLAADWSDDFGDGFTKTMAVKLGFITAIKMMKEDKENKEQRLNF